MSNITNIIKELKSNPLFYLFLSSRELFHSNFWFWLSTLNKIETVKIFSNRKISSDIIFKREHNQKTDDFKSKVDLYIINEIVIENKVKDFPKIEQLERIKNSFQGNNIEFILITLFWTEELYFEGWNIKTYKDISNAINPENFTNNKYHQNLIYDYKKLTLNLSELVEQLSIKQEYDFSNSLNGDLYTKLNEIKLWEGYQKLRASHLQLNFTNSNEHNVNTGYGINNQKATIDFFLELENEYKIGIQIEDLQYRKFIIGKKAAEFAENLIKTNLFFNDEFIGRGNKKYLNYGEHFKYQYKKIDSIITFKELFSRINNDFKDIIDNIKIIKREIPKN